MFNITVSSEFRATCPSYKGVAVYATVSNSESSVELWQKIDSEVQAMRARSTVESIKDISGIQATRAAYRAAGKAPSRYRPACEQLARRVLQGKELYRVNTIVDLMNLVSLRFGYSTAALDADHVVGKDIELGIGHEGEPYEAIGRGTLNIAALPTYRDAQGAFATPTSDSTRTMLSLDTSHVLVIINGFDGNEDTIRAATDYSVELLKEFADLGEYEIIRYE